MNIKLKNNVFKLDLFYLLFLISFFIFSIFLYAKNQVDNPFYYPGLFLIFLIGLLSSFTTLRIFLLKDSFFFLLKSVKYLMIIFFIPFLISSFDNYQYSFFPLEKQNILLIFNFVYLLFSLFILFKDFTKNFFNYFKYFFEKLKFNIKFLIRKTFKFSLLFVSLIFVLLVVGVLPGNNFWWFILFVVFSILIFTIIWHVLLFFVSEKSANIWGLFVLKSLPVIPLIFSVYYCDYYCPPSFLVLVFIIIILYLPYAFYIIVRSIFIPKKSQ